MNCFSPPTPSELFCSDFTCLKWGPQPVYTSMAPPAAVELRWFTRAADLPVFGSDTAVLQILCTKQGDLKGCYITEHFYPLLPNVVRFLISSPTCFGMSLLYWAPSLSGEDADACHSWVSDVATSALRIRLTGIKTAILGKNREGFILVSTCFLWKFKWFTFRK